MSSTSHDPHADPTTADPSGGEHGAGDHGGGDHDGNAHDGGEPLGPINVIAWGAGAVGIVAGLIVAAVLASRTGWLG